MPINLVGIIEEPGYLDSALSSEMSIGGVLHVVFATGDDTVEAYRHECTVPDHEMCVLRERNVCNAYFPSHDYLLASDFVPVDVVRSLAVHLLCGKEDGVPELLEALNANAGQIESVNMGTKQAILGGD